MGTIFIGIAVAALAALSVLQIVKDRKAGKCNCGRKCGACRYAQ